MVLNGIILSLVTWSYDPSCRSSNHVPLILSIVPMQVQIFNKNSFKREHLKYAQGLKYMQIWKYIDNKDFF